MTGSEFGDQAGLFLEASYLKDLSSEFSSVQVNGSFFF